MPLRCVVVPCPLSSPKLVIEHIAVLTLLQANANVVTLPLFACFNPSPSFYDIFNGYTLGPSALIVILVGIFCCGGACHFARGKSLDDKPFEAFKDRLIKVSLLSRNLRNGSLRVPRAPHTF